MSEWKSRAGLTASLASDRDQREGKAFAHLDEVPNRRRPKACQERRGTFIRDDIAPACEEVHPAKRRVDLDARLDDINRCSVQASQFISKDRKREGRKGSRVMPPCVTLERDIA